MLSSGACRSPYKVFDAYKDTCCLQPSEGSTTCQKIKMSWITHGHTGPGPCPLSFTQRRSLRTLRSLGQNIYSEVTLCTASLALPK